MAENTKIEWCDHTFNPWIGCTEVSKACTGGGGCDGCYAKVSTPARVLRSKGIETWGPGAQRVRTKTWGDPVKWNKRHAAFFAEHGRRQRVFCASLADVFDNEVDPQWRADLFRLIHNTPDLDWLLLTKRIGNAYWMMAEAAAFGPKRHWDAERGWPNVWLGATIVNQEEADRDIPKLLAVPARVRFLSMEPLLGSVDLSRWLDIYQYEEGSAWGRRNIGHLHDMLDWVIVGGESGPGARPAQLQWFRASVQQCRAAGVPVLVKQLGREVLDDGISSPGEHWPAGTVRSPITRHTNADPGFIVRLQHPKGGDWSEWPEDLRVRQFPEVC